MLSKSSNSAKSASNVDTVGLGVSMGPKKNGVGVGGVFGGSITTDVLQRLLLMLYYVSAVP